MILFCTGTNRQDFTRMVKAADDYAQTTSERIIVQYGHTHYKFKNIKECFSFCSKDDMLGLMKEADVLVLQGGCGAICEAVKMGKRIVSIPRIDGVEHIHNQEQYVRKMEELGCVIGVYDIKDLSNAIEKAKTYSFKPIEKGQGPSIIKEILYDWFSIR